MTELANQTALLPTPFHARAAAACRTNEWSRWAGYTTVDVYTDVALEYFAARNNATIWDLTPMIKYHIEGPRRRALSESSGYPRYAQAAGRARGLRSVV